MYDKPNNLLGADEPEDTVTASDLARLCRLSALLRTWILTDPTMDGFALARRFTGSVTGEKAAIVEFSVHLPAETV